MDKTVVVVEDDEDMRLLLDHAFRNDQRFRVIAQVADAREAIEAIRSHQPDLVVLDHYIHGKVMGLDSAPVIKTVAPDTKLLVFTQKDLGLEAYLEPEVDAYLRKDELARVVPVARRLLRLDAD